MKEPSIIDEDTWIDEVDIEEIDLSSIQESSNLEIFQDYKKILWVEETAKDRLGKSSWIFKIARKYTLSLIQKKRRMIEKEILTY